MGLSKDDILKASDLPVEELHIPQWGGIVYVKAMTGKERDAFEADSLERKENSTTKTSELADLRARLAVVTLVDEDGRPMFDNTQESINLLSAKSASALDLIFDLASRLNGFSQADVEELAGNLESAPVESSTSA